LSDLPEASHNVTYLQHPAIETRSNGSNQIQPFSNSDIGKQQQSGSDRYIAAHCIYKAVS